MKRLLPYIFISLVTLALGALILYTKYSRINTPKTLTTTRKIIGKISPKTINDKEAINYNNIIYSSIDYVATQDKNTPNVPIIVHNRSGEIIYQIDNPDIIKGDIIGVSDSNIYWQEPYNIYRYNHKEKTTAIISLPQKSLYSIEHKGGIYSIGVDSLTSITCLSVYNISNASIDSVHNRISLQYNNKYTLTPEKYLAYQSVFSITDSGVSFCLLHMPYVYVIDNKQEVHIIQTIDNVPPPKIIEYKEMYLFERGGTFNSNVGAFLLDDLVYILSYRVSNDKELVLDCYGIHKADYRGSLIVSNVGELNNRDIDRIFGIGDNMLIKTNKGLIRLSTSEIKLATKTLE